MRILRTVVDLREALAGPRRAGRRIGLVPTMGAFHGGHLSLMRRARASTDVVVVSLFVNPAQFSGGEDLETYPRDEARDATLAAEEGVDVLFAPGVAEVYPDGFATTIAVDGVAQMLESAARPGHFAGVATVVAKLLNMVEPDVAVFGQKDAQQAIMLRRLVRDLNFPVEIEVCPTVREADGLAMSSRNAYLQAAERARALALPAALDAAASVVAEGERDAAAVLAAARRALHAAGLEPEYLEIVAADTFAPVATVDGEAVVAIAATVGRARLIDNVVVRAPASAAPTPDREIQRCSG